jgi:hypothetical protein
LGFTNNTEAVGAVIVSRVFHKRVVVRRQCQTKTTGSASAAAHPASGSKLTPLREGGGTINLKILAAV